MWTLVCWCFCIVILKVNGNQTVETSLERFHFLNQTEPNANDSFTFGQKYQPPHLADMLNHDANFACLSSLPDVVTEEKVDDLIKLFKNQNKSLVEIRGLPEEQNENLIFHVRSIATEIGFKAIFQILAAARLGTKNVTAFPRIVLVLLDNVNAGYDLVMMNREWQRIAKIEKFNASTVPKMFINECLTKPMRRLLFEVKQFCKNEGFVYQTKYGVISIMKNGYGEELVIKNFQDLESLMHREVHKKIINVLSNYYNHSLHGVQQLKILTNLKNYSSMLQGLSEELPYELASNLCKPLRQAGQYAVEIVGIPEVVNVTTMNLVKAYARGIDLNKLNIRAAYRLAPEVWGQSGKPRAVFAVMGSQKAMNDMIRLCKLNNYSSNFNNTGYNKIYVNKFLSKEMKSLMYQTKGFCKSFHYSYVMRDDIIFVRDSKLGRNGTSIAISTHEELQKLYSKVSHVSNHTVQYERKKDVGLINNFPNHNTSFVPKSNKPSIHEENDEIKYNELELVLAKTRKQKKYPLQIQGLAENRNEHLLATVYRYLIVIGFEQVSKVVACFRIEKINALLPGPRDILAVVQHLNSKIEILLRSELHITKLKLNAKQGDNVTTSVVTISDFPLQVHSSNSSAIDSFHQTARTTDKEQTPLMKSGHLKRKVTLNSEEKVKFLNKVATEKQFPIEFINIPEDNDENTLTIVHKYVRHIGLTYESEITSAHRVENKERQSNAPRVILAAVTSKAIRDEIIQVNRIHNLNARTNKKLLFKRPVEIDEHKTDFVKQLVLDANEFCNNTGFFVSDKGGVITVKDSEGKTKAIIKDYTDLQKFKDSILKEYFKPIVGIHNIDSYEVRSKETTLRSVIRLEDFGEETDVTI